MYHFSFLLATTLVCVLFCHDHTYFFVLYSVYYRKYVNYQLDWNVDIAKNLVAIAPYGGLVGKKNQLTLIVSESRD